MAAMRVRFWGVRGSATAPGAATARYGGHTACVEVRCGDRLVILDAGSGLRPLGLSLMAEAAGRPIEADIFLTHCHLDHVWGLPYFRPAYLPGTRLRVWAGHLLPDWTLAGVIGRLIGEPLFPGGGALFRGDVSFLDFRCGEDVSPCPDVTVRTGALRHPGGGCGYRIEHGGAVLAYVTDTEHDGEALDPAVLRLAENANLLIYDCTYTETEYPSHVGRGHSTWQHGVRLAEAAGARKLALFHHEPARNDDALDAIAAEAAARRPGTFAAAEGLSLTLPE